MELRVYGADHTVNDNMPLQPFLTTYGSHIFEPSGYASLRELRRACDAACQPPEGGEAGLPLCDAYCAPRVHHIEHVRQLQQVVIRRNGKPLVQQLPRLLQDTGVSCGHGSAAVSTTVCGLVSHSIFTLPRIRTGLWRGLPPL